MSNLMNVNCLRPALRSRLLWLYQREDNKDRKLRDGEIGANREKSGRRRVRRIDSSAGRARKTRGRETSQGEKEAPETHDVLLLQGLAGPSSTTTCSSLSTSCHLMPNPFIHCGVFTNHCLNSLQAVVKRWFKSSPCRESTHWRYNRGYCGGASLLQGNCLTQRNPCACKKRGGFQLGLQRPTSVSLFEVNKPKFEGG